MSIKFNYNFPQIARESGFKLHLYNDGFMDWRYIGALEIERVLREQNLEQIDSILGHLAEAPLGSILDTNILDSGIAKYFIFLQFSLQYLLFCRKFLDETIMELREAHVKSEMELAKLRTSHTEASNEILQLHKKLTQMEAIHEVIYPCHLCTKNFVSNESLNLHISRKHCNTGRIFIDKNKEVSTHAPKDKDNDLNLINTIKLELEIKQLKERLNIAEKEIKDRSAESSNKSSPRVPQQLKVTKHIGIQSNLIDIKEKDDTTAESDGDVKEQIEQLRSLQHKIHNIEAWKDAYKTNNEECITEINEKLADIVQTLGKSNNSLDLIVDKNEVRQEICSPTVEDLERLLSQKVEEISKASVHKIEEVAHQMELNYKERIKELETEIKKINFESSSSARQPIINSNVQDDKHKPILSSKMQLPTAEKPATEIISKDNVDLHTYAITKIKEKENVTRVEDIEHLDSVSSQSNETYIKSLEKNNDETPKIASQKILAELYSSNEFTDISESLSSEHDSSESEKETSFEMDLVKRIVPNENKEKLQIKSSSNTRKKEATISKKIEKPKSKLLKSKQSTRFDAKRLTNQKLSTFGFNLRTKNSPKNNIKKISQNLAEEKIKQKTPFNATRKKIKKFVDKLRSNKTPVQSEHTLTNTKPIQIVDAKNVSNQHKATSNSTIDSFDENELESSTPLTNKSLTKDDFKQRLEYILASPIRQPNSLTNPTVKTVVPNSNNQVKRLPVPIPRKRVMFNTLTSDTESNDEHKTGK